MNDDPIIKCSPDVILCRYHVLIKHNESQETPFDNFLAFAPVFEKTKPRKLDFITFSHWLKKSTKLVQRNGFDDFLAVAPEVDKTSPRKLDLMIFQAWLKESVKAVPGSSI